MPQIVTGIGERDGARYALICGDPARVDRIAEEFEDPVLVKQNREFRIMSGGWEGKKVIIASTGIGGPSAAILMEELANTGTDTFIRIGTSGGVASGLKKGEAVITTGAFRKDGTSRSYVPEGFPAIAHHQVLRALLNSAADRRLKVHLGVTMSIDGFYTENKILEEGKIRSMSHGGFMLSASRDTLSDARQMGVKNVEMEMGTVLTLTTLWGMRGGGICVVSDVTPWEQTEALIDPETGMKNCILIAAGAIKKIIVEDQGE